MPDLVKLEGGIVASSCSSGLLKDMGVLSDERDRRMIELSSLTGSSFRCCRRLVVFIACISAPRENYPADVLLVFDTADVWQGGGEGRGGRHVASVAAIVTCSYLPAADVI